MLYSHHSEVPAAAWPWANFTPAELASRGDGSLLLEEDAIGRLQWARNQADRAFHIHSAYRDPIHNARVGGAPRSRHKSGDAFDIGLLGHARHVLLNLCRAAGFTGFGFYQTFLHVDLGPRRTWYGGNIARQLWKS